MDAAGVVGAVDHPVDARRTTIGSITAGGLVLVRMPPRVEDEAQLILDGLAQGDRLALQVDLEGDPAHIAAAGVVFEIAAGETDPPLIHTEAARLAGDGPATAQAVTELRLLPPDDTSHGRASRRTTERWHVQRAYLSRPQAVTAVETPLV